MGTALGQKKANIGRNEEGEYGGGGIDTHGVNTSRQDVGLTPSILTHKNAFKRSWGLTGPAAISAISLFILFFLFFGLGHNNLH
jgi:hypothetical protein